MDNVSWYDTLNKEKKIPIVQRLLVFCNCTGHLTTDKGSSPNFAYNIKPI